MARVMGNAYHARPQHAAMKEKSVLQNLHNGSVRILVRLYALDGLMKIRIKWLARSRNSLQPMFCERLPKLPINQFEPFPILLVRRVVMRLERPFESIQHRQKILNYASRALTPIFLALAIDALAVILKIRLSPHHRLCQLVFFSLQSGNLLGKSGGGGTLGGQRVSRVLSALGTRGKLNHFALPFLFSIIAFVHGF